MGEKGVKRRREDRDVEKEKNCKLVKKGELTGCNPLFLLSRRIRKTNNLEIQTNYKQTHERFSFDELVSRQNWKQIPLCVIAFEKLLLGLAW